MLRTAGILLTAVWGVAALGGPQAHAAGRIAPEGGALIQTQFRDEQPRGYDDQRRGYDDQRRGYDDQRRGYDDQRREDDEQRRREDDQRRRYDDQRRGDERRGGYEPQRTGRGGSYQQSCENIRQQGSVLSAVCGAGRGGHVESSLDLRRCGGTDVGNIGGYLTCGNTRGSGRRID